VKSFNLSDWALDHRSLVWYLMIISIIAGFMSYVGLGREEDPSFAVKTMVIQAQWPGASVEETISQVTERIERKLEELPTLDYTRSQATPGQTTIYVNLKDTTRPREVASSWIEVRNLIGDIAPQFPQGVLGPFFNDRFGDVFGNIYAFTADGLNSRQLRDYVESVRARVLAVPNAGRVDLIGARDEVIYLDFSMRQIASLGIDLQSVVQTLQTQNSVTPSGVIQSGPERVSVRVGGQFASEESLRSINLQVDGRFFRLSDIATISRGYVDPPQPQFRFKGEPAIGLAIGMKPGANLLEFGAALKKTMDAIVADLPIGVGVHLVSDQPQVVEEAVGGFTKALFEAVAIVLVVSFVSLGLRAGFVVSLSIPLVLAMTFTVMEYAGISMQRISLGALIIALGLLVDDAMIAVEMMVAKLEEGVPLRKAATAVYTSTAFPMLTGTLVTVASFIPVGLNSSSAGEYTYTLFVVIAASLLLSWIVAVLFAPLLGVALLPKTMKAHHGDPGRFALVFSWLLRLAVRRRWVTIVVTLGAFGLSMYAMRFVQNQFFPDSDRPELIINWALPQNASIIETKAQMDRFEAEALAGEPEIKRWSSYVGQGAVRFVLAFETLTAGPNVGQIVIVTSGMEARDKLKAKLQNFAHDHFPGTDIQVDLLPMGPPAGRPIQFRLSGPDTQKVRGYAQDLAEVVSREQTVGAVSLDWNEPARVIKVDVLQDKARQLGVSSQSIAALLNTVVKGRTITQVRDDIYLVNVVGRSRDDERGSIEVLRSLQLPGRNGQPVPLSSLAIFRAEMEQPAVWRRARLPTVTLKGGINGGDQAATVMARLKPPVDAFAATLPPGYAVAVAGPVENSAKSQAPIAAVVPLMLFAMATVLMIQLQSFQRLFLAMAVAPLGMIGVVAAMVPSGAPLGFVAILGVLALIGILIRNAVILIVQINDLRAEGRDHWTAVIEATEHRMRPIMLTAAAACLALIPISHEVFWGPMAYAMMGGIFVGTLLTLLFLPALYTVWFRISEPTRDPASTSTV